MDDINHEKTIPTYVERVKTYPTTKFRSIRSQNLEEEILHKHFVEGWKVPQIAEKYNISVGTVTSFINDYLLANYDDSLLEETALLDAHNHLGIMTTFFSGAFYVAREMAMTAIFARKLREELASYLAKHGVIETAKNRDLMQAWNDITNKTVQYQNLATKQMETYVKLMEKVLDKQREVAFVKVLFDLIQKADPTVVEKLHAALEEDEYARSVLESMSGEAILKAFRARRKGEFLDMESFEKLQDELLLED